MKIYTLSFLESSQWQKRTLFLNDFHSNYCPGGSCSIGLGEQPRGQERNGSLGRKDDTQERGFGGLRSGIVEVLIEVYIDLLEPT